MNLYEELDSHYQMWSNDMDIRRTRKNGFHDITDAYYGILPEDWPYMSNIVVPLIRTSLIEKNARLLNSKLRGRLVPREGGDMISANLNNSILDYQWDTANDGGSMQVKLGISDMDTRLYGSKFAYIYWKYERMGEKVKFDGNEMLPLSILDCGIDPTASHIRDAKWFQMRRWEKFEDLENAVDGLGKPLYKNLDKVKRAMSGKMQKQSARRNEYTPRTLQLRSLEDHMGEDKSFPVILVVTEFREDRFYTFLPDYGEVISNIPNPFIHGKIPIAQLRYYHLEHDPIGESEVEPVLGLWRAIQATVNAYLDEMILKIRPPLKVIENAARIETIQYGPEAQWLVDRQDAIEEMRSSGDTLQYYQTTYQSMVSAFNTAMGDLSQGVSAFDPFQGGGENKTATEVKATVKQQNVRDQKNQNDLVEFIKDIMMMWLSNNKQFLFSDPSKKEHVLRIVGEEKYDIFRRSGLAEYELIDGAEQIISDNIEALGGDVTDEQIMDMIDMASMPKYPVITNPKEKDPTKIEMKPKMVISDVGSVADITVVPSDLEGTYDYIPDVKSMSVGASEEYMQARQRLLADMQNGNVVQLLAQEGWRAKFKDLYVTTIEDTGIQDATRFFEKIPTAPALGAGNEAMGGVLNTGVNPAVQGVPAPNAFGGFPEQMAQPGGFPNAGAIPQGI